MGGGGDRRHAVSRRDLGHGTTQARKIGAGLGEAGADPCPHLDLRAQELRTDLAGEPSLAFGQHRRRRIVDDIPRRPVDEKIFFLDAKGEFGFGQGNTLGVRICDRAWAN
jgi:hypothetical protein